MSKNNSALDLKLKPGLTITPQIQQAIKILGMNALEMQQEINLMLIQNFMLHSDESEGEVLDTEIEVEGVLNGISGDLKYDAQWDDYYDSDWLDHAPYQEKEQNIEGYAAQQSLASYICEQLAQMALTPSVYDTAEILAYLLDENGYLCEKSDVIARQYHLRLSCVKEAIAAIQSCQPSGVGAYNLAECLALQIEALPLNTPYLAVLKRIMVRYFPFIAKKPTLIQQRLGIDANTYAHAIALLRSLNPHPGAAFSVERVEAIQPEIIVDEIGGISYVKTTEVLYPTLRINEAYKALINQLSEQDKRLLQAQLSEARSFISAIDKRASTIQRVANVIVAMQQEFFQEGARAMKTLTRQQVAKMLNLHESTVARAVNGKYLLCKRGLFELRYFFSNTVETVEGERQSTIVIRAMIADMVQAEDREKPISDQCITDDLLRAGYKISRRSVAKYREMLNIPATNDRRKRK